MYLTGAALFAQNASDFLPFQNGNQWIYQVLDRRDDPVTTTIAQTAEMGGKTYYGFTGLYANQWLRIDENGAVVSYDETTRSERVYIAPNGVVTPFAPDCGQTGRVTNTNYEYSGPLGVFNGVIEVRYDPGACRDAGLVRELYLPYIGLIQRTEQTIAGPRTYDLIYARIGGVTVVTAPETSFTVALDNSTYPAPSPILVRLALRHTGPRPLHLDFNSGQEFDIVIRNERGEVVLAWSSNKMFIQVLHSLDIMGEKNWAATLPMTGIAPGNYTAEGFLTTAGAKKYTGSVAFTLTGPSPARP
mgnify:CR=1 FL=1